MSNCDSRSCCLMGHYYSVVELHGDQYVLDAQCVWALIKPLLSNGPAWIHAKAFKALMPFLL